MGEPHREELNSISSSGKKSQKYNKIWMSYKVSQVGDGEIMQSSDSKTFQISTFAIL